MNAKIDTEVVIGGKLFTLRGYEEEDYLQRVATYINNKLNEYGKMESFVRQNSETQAILIQLNIADDYFKAKKQIEVLEADLKKKDEELYDLKHKLVSAQIQLENLGEKFKEHQ